MNTRPISSTTLARSKPIAYSASTERVKESDLDECIKLLKELNCLRTTDGRRISEWITVEGFEPWWFIQERLFWYVLVPYVRNRQQFGKVSALQHFTAEKKLKETGKISRQLSCCKWFRSTGRMMGYLGLAIISIVSVILFRLKRFETLVYIIDNISDGVDHDFRIATIYQELRQRRYRFGEYIHTHNLRRSWFNLWRRGRPVVILEPLARAALTLFCRGRFRSQDFPEILGDPSHKDRTFLLATAKQALRWSQESAFKVAMLKHVVRWQRVKRAIILDDSRHANELIAACKILNIPTLGYMHGLLNRYHSGLMAYEFGSARKHTFDLYGLWSEYFRERVLKGQLYDRQNTFVCGMLRPPSEEELATVLRTRRTNELPIRVLVVWEPRAVQEEVALYVEELLRDNRFDVMLKQRRGEKSLNLENRVQDVGKMRVIDSETVYHALSQADVVVGTYSTILYEAALGLRPAVVLNTSFTYGYDILRDRLAEFAELPELLPKVILRAHALPVEELIRRRDIIWGSTVMNGAGLLFDTAEARVW